MMALSLAVRPKMYLARGYFLHLRKWLYCRNLLIPMRVLCLDHSDSLWSFESLANEATNFLWLKYRIYNGYLKCFFFFFKEDSYKPAESCRSFIYHL